MRAVGSPEFGDAQPFHAGRTELALGVDDGNLLLECHARQGVFHALLDGFRIVQIHGLLLGLRLQGAEAGERCRECGFQEFHDIRFFCVVNISKDKQKKRRKRQHEGKKIGPPLHLLDGRRGCKWDAGACPQMLLRFRTNRYPQYHSNRNKAGGWQLLRLRLSAERTFASNKKVRRPCRHPL